MKIAILGAGFTGLAAAYELTKNGRHEVVVLEMEEKPGGLAVGFKYPGLDWSLERHYHHWFANDYFVLNLIKELGLGEELMFKAPKTSIYYQERIYPFSSPLDVLRFKPLGVWARLRTGAVSALLKAMPVAVAKKWLEDQTAYDFIKKYYGRQAFEIIWKPLFKSKFWSYAPRVGALWFWARIKKRTFKLGYLEGGFQVLADRLDEKIKAQGGVTTYGVEVKKLKVKSEKLKIFLRDKKGRVISRRFDKVIVTLPSAVFVKIAHLPQSYVKKLTSTNYLHALNMVLFMKEPFLTDGTYWLNINKKGFPFVGLVQQTNMIDPRHYGDQHILYVANYLPIDHPFLKMTKEELFKRFLPYLKKINPRIKDQGSRIKYEKFIGPFAQPIITPSYAKKIPSFETPLKDVYLANMSQVYPWDRGTNYAIELGQKVAKLIDNK